MGKKKRRNITVDKETEQILETHDLNASEEFRKYIKQKYGNIHMLEQKLEELQQKDDLLLNKKQQIEKQRQELKKDIRRLNNLLVKNDVMQQIKSNDKWRSKFNESIRLVKQADDKKMALEKNVEVLSEELPFDRGKLESVLEKSVEV